MCVCLCYEDNDVDLHAPTRFSDPLTESTESAEEKIGREKYLLLATIDERYGCLILTAAVKHSFLSRKQVP